MTEMEELWKPTINECNHGDMQLIISGGEAQHWCNMCGEDAKDIIASLQARIAELETWAEHDEFAFGREPTDIPCSNCRGPVIPFSIPNDIWNFAVRPDGHEHDNEYLCIGCFFNFLRRQIAALGGVLWRVDGDPRK